MKRLKDIRIITFPKFNELDIVEWIKKVSDWKKLNKLSKEILVYILKSCNVIPEKVLKVIKYIKTWYMVKVTIYRSFGKVNLGTLIHKWKVELTQFCSGLSGNNNYGVQILYQFQIALHN